MLEDPVEIVKKVDVQPAPAGTGDVPVGLRETQDREFRIRVSAEALDNMKKRAVVFSENASTFSIICDEGPRLGGDDSAPSPLCYFSAAIAFWLLTQLSRYGKIAKLSVKSIRVEQEARFFVTGSALAGTMRGGCLGVETHIHVESDEPPDRVRQLIKIGEQTCYTLQSLTHPVPVRTRASLNGSELGLEAI